jgi:hypothetical protein
MIGDVTIYQWFTLGLGALGFLLTWTGMVISVTRAVNKIKEDIEQEQRTKDDQASTTMQTMRDRLSSIELFGRDNYVLKRDFLDALQKVETTLIRTTDDIKKDIRSLGNQLSSMISGNRRTED